MAQTNALIETIEVEEGQPFPLDFQTEVLEAKWVAVSAEAKKKGAKRRLQVTVLRRGV